MKPFFAGDPDSPEYKRYYQDCKVHNRPVIKIRPPENGYSRLELSYLPVYNEDGTFGSMSEEQQEKMIKLLGRYEKYMKPDSMQMWTRDYMTVEIEPTAAERMAMKLRRILSDHRTTDS